MPIEWPFMARKADAPPPPNRAQRRAMEQAAKRQQRRGQRAFDRAQKSASNAKAE